ncbi:hypothetical protein C8F04DRAFT_1145295 [Mycena alexandri]|uniref:C2H2-type domain-containing protein n=1 Tax=Mycena alexandri TaxID=1745969 RepID=A0AAD6WTA3_9AGAR|nr:hypothetical protein C8F04DRAFT_1145295 [Mycena alexandri]
MTHTPPVPNPLLCPEPSCGRIFTHPRDLNVHSHVHDGVRDSEDLYEKLKCPMTGCSFKTLQLKHLEVHVETAHHDQRRQFQCLQTHCGFSTTSQGALTRHYRERHGMEPPISVRKPPVRRRIPKRTNEHPTPVASTSLLPDLPRFSVLAFNGPAAPSSLSASALPGVSPALSSEINKYYPAAAYNTLPASTSVASPWNSTRTGLTSAAALGPATGPHSCQSVRITPESVRPRQLPNYLYPPQSDTWVSWRDEYDVAPDVIAVATGEIALCERTMHSLTEYLPVPMDVGMADKRFLWA